MPFCLKVAKILHARLYIYNSQMYIIKINKVEDFRKYYNAYLLELTKNENIGNIKF